MCLLIVNVFFFLTQHFCLFVQNSRNGIALFYPVLITNHLFLVRATFLRSTTFDCIITRDTKQPISVKVPQDIFFLKQIFDTMMKITHITLTSHVPQNILRWRWLEFLTLHVYDKNITTMRESRNLEKKKRNTYRLLHNSTTEILTVDLQRFKLNKNCDALHVQTIRNL